MTTITRLGFVAFAGALGALMAGAPAHATLIADGITYTLTETTITATTAQFDLHISGINGTSDNEKGRAGVNAIAFGLPSNFSSATAPSGFTYEAGGLNANGCNGSGDFFCFTANTTPTATPGLPANSSLDFVFSISLSSGSFTSYDPDFKIDWIGSKNHYDLVSETLAPAPGAPVPEPVSMAMVGVGLLGLSVVRGRRRSA
jgi:hypothetical protein